MGDLEPDILASIVRSIDRIRTELDQIELALGRNCRSSTASDPEESGLSGLSELDKNTQKVIDTLIRLGGSASYRTLVRRSGLTYRQVEETKDNLVQGGGYVTQVVYERNGRHGCIWTAPEYSSQIPEGALYCGDYEPPI